MEEDRQPDRPRNQWQAKQVYAMGVVCLLLGLAAGYLVRGSQAPKVANAPLDRATENNGIVSDPHAQQMPSLEQMKQMGNKAAEPLLSKLKTDPNNPDLLAEIGNIYKSAHQFKEAVGYYESSLKIKAKNTAVRTQLASCLYYSGDVDGALAQLQQALKDDPRDANSLFNLGVIRWKAKNDPTGAVAAWQQLLNSNPTLQENKRAEVEKLIADAKRGAEN